MASDVEEPWLDASSTDSVDIRGDIKVFKRVVFASNTENVLTLPNFRSFDAFAGLVVEP